MPEPAVVYHLLAAMLVLVDPLWGVWEYRRLTRRVRAGVSNAIVAIYRKTILLNWTMTIGLGALWLGTGRPAAALGLAAPEGMRLPVGATITLIGLAVLYAQWRAVSILDEKGLAALRAQMAAFADFLPRTEQESRQFRLVAVTAGVCEEIWWRGFLIWYLTAYMGEWPAVFVGALLFGVLHLYQGPAGVMKTGATGLVMGILYVATGSLIWPVILHTAVDLQGGSIARRVLGAVPSAEPA